METEEEVVQRNIRNSLSARHPIQVGIQLIGIVVNNTPIEFGSTLSIIPRLQILLQQWENTISLIALNHSEVISILFFF